MHFYYGKKNTFKVGCWPQLSSSFFMLEIWKCTLHALRASELDAFGDKNQVHERCKRLGITTYVEVPKISPGWMHKPKGTLPILYEHSWINPDFIHLYIAEGIDSTSDQSSPLPFHLILLVVTIPSMQLWNFNQIL